VHPPGALRVNKIEIVSGIILIGIGGILHYSGINISVLGKPVVFYGMIIGGVVLLWDGIF